MAKARVLQDKSDPGVVLDERLLQSWEIVMRAERKSPRTIDIYLTRARTFMSWCASLDVEHLDVVPTERVEDVARQPDRSRTILAQVR